MAIQRRKLIAIVADPAPLRLETAATRNILGDHHLWQPEGENHYFLACYAPDWRAAQTLLSGLGATVLPWHRDPVTQVSHLLPANAPAPPAGIGGTDTGWAAQQKLFDRYHWPHFDPMAD